MVVGTLDALSDFHRFLPPTTMSSALAVARSRAIVSAPIPRFVSCSHWSFKRPHSSQLTSATTVFAPRGYSSLPRFSRNKAVPFRSTSESLRSLIAALLTFYCVNISCSIRHCYCVPIIHRGHCNVRGDGVPRARHPKAGRRRHRRSKSSLQALCGD